jgi:serine/threonine protein kinase
MLEPNAKLAGRYRFVESVQAGAKSVTWLAEDEQTQRRVVASAIGGARLSTLTSIVGVEHPHLATIIDVITDPSPLEIPSERGPVKAAAVALAEYVPGIVLSDQLKRGKLAPRHAVDLILRVANAVSALHARGGAHGAISLRSIVAAPSDGRAPPVLTQLVAPTSGAYSSPQRLQGAPPSSNDDAWALHASLYSTLSGVAPFSGGTKDLLIKSMLSQPRPLQAYGVSDQRLQLIIEAGFAQKAGRRAGVPELVSALEAWIAASTGSEPRSLADDDDEDYPTLMMPGLVSEVPEGEATLSDAPRTEELLRLSSGAQDQPPSTPFDLATELGRGEAPRRFEPVEPPKPPRPTKAPLPAEPLTEPERVTRESDPTLTEPQPASLPLATPGDWAPEFELEPAPAVAPQSARHPQAGARASERRLIAWIILTFLAAALLTLAALWAYLHYR